MALVLVLDMHGQGFEFNQVTVSELFAFYFFLWYLELDVPWHEPQNKNILGLDVFCGLSGCTGGNFSYVRLLLQLTQSTLWSLPIKHAVSLCIPPS